jgi:arsenate reductase (glutaredoxin)
MNTSVTIYHNPRCSKSRQALALLEDHGIKPAIVLYLEHPPDVRTLERLLAQLGMSARSLLRSGEAAYSELGLDDPTLTEAALIEAMAAQPILIERPIVVTSKGAALGRPLDNVLGIL